MCSHFSCKRQRVVLQPAGIARRSGSERVNNREVSEQIVDQMSASRTKIQLNESVENPEETDAEETWMKMNGRAIVSGERLQKHLSEAVSCRF